ncbi:hypothetical protein SPI_03900 [Niveomyces insectorum RCEF 264]|uniref:Uncharacterized protein n=1 Tax=Niveomyces insectorum RCEF 264 TaxID=1081102 RepID=A0A167WFS8_9HYPO|nr:hypothetical protein SPI_03900 [Niveomyces insectorum RCEF 264]
MPSRNSFDIRRLFASSRRRSVADNEVDGGVHVASTNRHTLVHGSSRSRSSTIFGSAADEPDADEVDRIKAVVAAAAAATVARHRPHETGVDSDGKHLDRIRGEAEDALVRKAKREKETNAVRKTQATSKAMAMLPSSPSADEKETTQNHRAQRQQRHHHPLQMQRKHMSSQKNLFRPAQSPPAPLCLCTKGVQHDHHHQHQKRQQVAGNRHGCLCSSNSTAASPLSLSSQRDRVTAHKESGQQSPCARTLGPLPFTTAYPLSDASSSSSIPAISVHLPLPSLLSQLNESFGLSTDEQDIPTPEKEQFCKPLDRKKDSGVDLGHDGPDLLFDDSQGKNQHHHHDTHHANGEAGNRGSSLYLSEGPSLDLLEALSIQPEEATRLREKYRRYCGHQHQQDDRCATGGMTAPHQLGLLGERDGPDDDAAANSLGDGSITPTFTHPRRAPSPTGSSRRIMPDTHNGEAAITSAKPSSFLPVTTSDTTESNAPETHTRFSPLPLTSPALVRNPSVVAASRFRVQRKRSKKARRRDWTTFAKTKKNYHNKNNTSTMHSTKTPTKGHATGRQTAANQGSSNGGTRWTLPDNVTALFHGRGRLFSRMEVNETLPFEKLQAIRASRALAEQLRHEYAPTSDVESEAETAPEWPTKSELLSQRQQQTPSQQAQNPQSVPEPDLKQGLGHDQQSQLPPIRQRSPPPVPLPPPPHIASLMAWPSLDDLRMGEVDESPTPVEPFHLQDLPSRIGAAGVRMSILLPVEEEEAYFASSVAAHKAKQKEKEKEKRREEGRKVNTKSLGGKANSKENRSSVSSAPWVAQNNKAGKTTLGPSLPGKNPLRFSNRQATQNMPSIPELTVTDMHNTSYRHDDFPLAPARSAAVAAVTTTTTGTTPAVTRPPPPASMVITQRHANDGDLYFPATPFSLVMPTYRHGPIRITPPERLGHRRPPMAVLDETLDWTAFQMAILGGAGDLFSESIDYGRSSAEADEADQLVVWFHALGFAPERLVQNAADEEDGAADNRPWQRPNVHTRDAHSLNAPLLAPTSQLSAPRAAMPQVSMLPSTYGVSYHPADPSTAVPWYNNMSASGGGSSSSRCSGRDSGSSYASHNWHTHSANSSTSTSASTHTAYSRCFGSRFSGEGFPLQPQSQSQSQSQSQPQPQPQPRSQLPPGSAGGFLCTPTNALPQPALELPPAHIAEMPASRTPPPPPSRSSLFAAQPHRHHHHSHQQAQQSRTSLASFASYDSYDSLPPSPMADLVMTCGANGTEYLAPMGYNLGHDLGDFLKWGSENVSAMEADESS